MLFFCFITRRPQMSTRNDPLFHSTTLFRSESGARQIGERRIARPEIVEAQPHAEVEQPLEHRRRAGAFVQKHALGHFEFEPLGGKLALQQRARSEEHTSELQSLMSISYAVFCMKTKKTKARQHNNTIY